VGHERKAAPPGNRDTAGAIVGLLGGGQPNVGLLRIIDTGFGRVSPLRSDIPTGGLRNVRSR